MGWWIGWVELKCVDRRSWQLCVQHVLQGSSLRSSSLNGPSEEPDLPSPIPAASTPVGPISAFGSSGDVRQGPLEILALGRGSSGRITQVLLYPLAWIPGTGVIISVLWRRGDPSNRLWVNSQRMGLKPSPAWLEIAIEKQCHLLTIVSSGEALAKTLADVWRLGRRRFIPTGWRMRSLNWNCYTLRRRR